MGAAEHPESPADTARRLLSRIAYATLATADSSGRPWATPVWLAARDDLTEFFWLSRPETRHSRNLAERPDLSFVVYDSTTPVGGAEALYVEAVAQQPAGGELSDAIAVFSAASVSRGERAWAEADVTGASPLRLYRARATELYVLDPDERRVRVDPRDSRSTSE
ncbi:pyridoxamine 5'-phosphate oxidase family protein [Agromyces sp. G08B096]|uniref:Pyridoxamine 5'-phosphate oxidase family protein n=1 Tax=Agromyces sp. G08B096 TaxID=3156399 RepID=A0AAU7WA68_9MICO